MNHLKSMQEVVARIDRERALLHATLEERRALIYALRPFAEAFKALPQGLQDQTLAEHSKFSSPRPEDTAVVVLIGNKKIRAGHLLMAALACDKAEKLEAEEPTGG
jgi:hypothetical protein